jgi:hypothetical protein
MVISSDAYGALGQAKSGSTQPSQHRVAQVARDFKLHPLKQLVQILSLRFGSQNLTVNEYYDLRLFEPKHTSATRKGFLGQAGINALNQMINPDELRKTQGFIANKLGYLAHLQEHGIYVGKTQALVSSHHAPKETLVLHDESALKNFLTKTAKYPLFGKPHISSGPQLDRNMRIWIERRKGTQLILGNGRTVPLNTLISEIFSQHAEGYVFQSALCPHNDLKAAAGPTMGCIRIVTTHDGQHIEPLYAVWKMPAPRAMSDDLEQPGSMRALLCIESGEVLRCYRGTGLNREELHSHPRTGAPLIGRALPHWSKLLEIANRAHALTPEFGICGFDIAITQTGPVIIKGTAQPNHMLYQFAANEGICAEKYSDLWERVKSRPIMRPD